MNIVAMSEEGVVVQTSSGVQTIGFCEIDEGHHLISDSESFRLGLAVASYHAIRAANDEKEG